MEIEKYGYDLLGSLSKDLTALQGMSTVYQELLQNAEDAGSSTYHLDFCDDALYVGNDGVFKEEHFKAIKLVGSGHKRHDADRIGRFGVGFVSVYQLSDEPELYSVGKKVTFVPMKEAVRNEQSKPPRPWNTVFRLPWAPVGSPLRVALDSEAKKVNLDSFVLEAIAALTESGMFLQKIRTIHIYKNGVEVEKLEFLRTQGSTTLRKKAGEIRYRTYELPLTTEALRLQNRYGRRPNTPLMVARPLSPAPDFRGKMYAFLPTQDTTELPFHLNADFYPNMDRKRLLWEGETGKDFNLAVLESLITGLQSIVLSIRDQEGAEALYTFLGACLNATRNPDASNKSGYPSLLHKFHQELKRLLATERLFKATNLAWYTRQEMALLSAPVQADELRTISLHLNTKLPPIEHKEYLQLFREAGIGEVKQIDFVEAYIKIFHQHRMSDIEVTGYLKVLQHQFVHQYENKYTSRTLDINCLKDLHGKWQTARALIQLPTERMELLTPLYPPDRLADPEWLNRSGPSYLRGLVSTVTPEEVVDHLQNQPSETFKQLFHVHNWPYQELYAFIQHVSTTKTRKLRIFPNKNHSRFLQIDQLAAVGRIPDPFNLRDTIHTDVLETWSQWLKSLGLVTLNADTYLTQLLPAHYSNLSSFDDRVQVLSFLAKYVTSDMMGVRQVWARMEIICCTDRTWRKPNEVHFQNDLLDALFLKKYPTADTTILKTEDTTRNIYQLLGVKPEVEAEDVLQQIRSRLNEPMTELEIKIREALMVHLGKLDRTELQKYTSLRELAWIPNAFTTRWMKPGDIYASSHMELMGRHLPHGKAYTLIPVNLSVESFLRMPQPTIQEVSRHLQDQVFSSQPIKGLDGTINKIFRWVNKELSQSREGTEGIKRTVQTWREWKILQVEPGKRLEPSKFFLQDPKLGKYRHRLSEEFQRSFKPLIEALGIRERPDWLDHLAVMAELKDLAQKSQQERDLLMRCWEQISHGLQEKDLAGFVKDFRDLGLHNHPIIPKDLSLKSALLTVQKAIYLNDLNPADIKAYQLPEARLLPRNFGSAKLWKALGVQFSEDYLVIDRIETSLPRPNHKMEEVLQERLASILRIVYKEKRGLTQLKTATDLLVGLQVMFCSDIQEVFHFKDDPTRRTRPLEWNHEPDEQRIFILDSESVHFSIATASALAGLLELEGHAAAVIDTILNKIPREGAFYLDKLHYSALPETLVVPTYSSETVSMQGFAGPGDSGPGTQELQPSEPPTSPLKETTSPQSMQTSTSNERAAAVQAEPSTPVKNAETRSIQHSSTPNHSPASQAETRSIQRSSTPNHPNDTKPVTPTGRPGAASQNPPLQRGAAQTSNSNRRPPQGGSNLGGYTQHATKHYVDVVQDLSEFRQQHNKEVEQKGMKALFTYLSRKKANFRDCSHETHLGYDVELLLGEGKAFIELKTLSGSWGEGSVIMSLNEVTTAYQEQDRYWLVVIENIYNNPEIHWIQNPFSRNTGIYISADWKRRANQSERL